MTDSEMLVLAAKAAGYKVLYGDDRIGLRLKHENRRFWKPLDDDGDAMRLSVTLRIGMFHDDLGVYCNYQQTKQLRIYFAEVPDKYEASRRAIVCAAAKIGKGMK